MSTMSNEAASARAGGDTSSSAGAAPPTSTVHSTRWLHVPASVPRRGSGAEAAKEYTYNLSPSDWIIPPAMSIQLLYFYAMPPEWSREGEAAIQEFMDATKLADAL